MLTRDLPVPLWIQILEVLRVRIAEHGPQLKGLSDQEIAREFGVSALTARRAVQDLVRDGLLVRHRGKGTFVAAKPMQGSVDNMDTLLSEWSVQGQDTEIRILERSRIVASMPIAAALQIQPGQLVGYLRRARYADGEPIGLDCRYIRSSVDERLDDSDVKHETLWEVLEKKLGMMNIKSSVTIRATAACAEDAVLLKIAPASPVLHREFHLVNMPTEPILIGHSIYHPNRFIHATTKRRSREWNAPEQPGREDGMPS